MTDHLATIWILSGIASCLIFVFAERDLFRNIEFSNAVFAAFILVCFCVVGPLGLSLLLLGLLITFLGSLLNAE